MTDRLTFSWRVDGVLLRCDSGEACFYLGDALGMSEDIHAVLSDGIDDDPTDLGSRQEPWIVLVIGWLC